MARLPQALDLNAPRGVVSRGEALDFSGVDRALQGAAQQVRRVDEVRRQADDEQAARIVQAAEAEYNAGAIERANAYDGRSPGYAQAELAAFDATFQPIQNREDLPDGVRMALTRRVQEAQARYGARALATEAETRSRRVAADRDASEQAAALRARMEVMGRFDALEDARRQAWDGASPGYAAGVLEDWRRTSEEVLAALPVEVQERLRPALLADEVQLQARALAAEDEAREANTNRTVADGLQMLVNRVRRDPSLIGRLDAEMAPVLAAAPAALRTRLANETRQEAAAAAVEARIERGEWDAVEADIEAGRFDNLDPARVERIRGRVETARANGVVVDAQRLADLEAARAADIRSILAGETPDSGLIAEARLLGGETLAAELRTDQEAARRIQPLIGRLRTLTPEQAAAELDRLADTATDAVGARTFELAREMVEQNRRARQDPAAWAATPIGPGDQAAATVRERLAAFQAQPTPETAQAYARATWTAQGQGGVPLQERRILDQATAEQWVEMLDRPEEAAQGLAQIAQRLELFGDGFRPQVTRELALAGLSNADLGAVIQYGRSPRMLNLYAAGRGVRETEAMPDRADRETLNTELTRALEGYRRTIGAGRGGEASLAAVRTAAVGLVAQGMSPRDAVRRAAAPITEAWDFEETYAIPRAAGVNRGVIRHHAARNVRRLTVNDGAELYAPPSDRYTPEQSRRLYADIVRETAFWRNLPDDSGVELVHPDPTGRPVRVRDRQGNEVVRTWSELERAVGVD
jgi:hypothetical protein